MLRLTETSSHHRELAIRYCKDRFAPYGRFATMPVSIAMLRDYEYEPHDFRDYLRDTYPLEKCHFYIPVALRECLERLEFEDAGLFTLQDYRLLFQLDSPANPRTDEQLEQDRCELLQQIERPSRMLKDHAQTLLKAIDFWKLRHKSKHGLWQDELAAERQRRALQRRLGGEDYDEGYSSS
jgi:hypothetical protein